VQISTSWATGWTIGVLGFDSRRELGIFLFTTVYRTALGPTQPPIQWVPGALSLGLKRPGREADHSLPSCSEVKNVWSYTSTPQYVFMAWCLVKQAAFNYIIYNTWSKYVGVDNLSVNQPTKLSSWPQFGLNVSQWELGNREYVKQLWMLMYCQILLELPERINKALFMPFLISLKDYFFFL
jgi:hypothetical protein